MLHVTMALTRTLLNLLVDECDENAALSAELEQRLTSKKIGLKLATKTKSDGKTLRRFSKRVEKSRIQRTESLHIIENQAYLIEALELHSKRPRQYIERVAIVVFAL